MDSYDDNIRRNISVDLQWMANDDLFLKLKIYNSYYEKRNTITMKEWKDFGFSNEDASAANAMNANVDITSYELSGNYALNDMHFLTFGAEYRDEKRDATVFDNTPNMSRKEVDYQAMVDFTTSYKFGQENNYEVYGGINNIFDEKVEDVLGSNVGTYFYAGLRAKF